MSAKLNTYVSALNEWIASKAVIMQISHYPVYLLHGRKKLDQT